MPTRLRRLLTVPLPLLLIGGLASADVITGRVVDENGVGVPGVDIDFLRADGGGGNHNEMNDGTDANGNFVTTVDPNVYEIRFYAPTPPTTTLLTGVLTPVVVVGTVNLGTIVLAPGVSLQGTVKNTAGIPVSGVKVDAFNDATGMEVLVKSNTTNAFGTFNLAVPTTSGLRGRFRTKGVIGQTLAPLELLGPIAGPTNVGTVTLRPGFHLNGTALTESGLPIAGADIDIINRATGNQAFTPSDNTNTLGVFDIVLELGNYNVELTAPFGLTLVGVEVKNLVFGGNTNLGPMTMRDGVVLSGTVRDWYGDPVQAADVNVRDVATGLDVFMGSDNSNALGAYSVIVPTGVLDVVFQPPGPHGPFEKDYFFGLAVSANTLLDAKLGRASSKGTVTMPPGTLPPKGPVVALPLSAPMIAGLQSPASDSIILELSGGQPMGTGQLLVGHRAHPTAILPITLDARGNTTVFLPAALASVATQAQFIAFDRKARSGFRLSRSHSLQGDL